MLEQPQLPTDPALNSIVQTLPPEVSAVPNKFWPQIRNVLIQKNKKVLLVIFCLLDDISLYAVGNTCRCF